MKLTKKEKNIAAQLNEISVPILYPLLFADLSKKTIPENITEKTYCVLAMVLACINTLIREGELKIVHNDVDKD